MKGASEGMQLDIKWHKPIPLRDGSKQRLVYAADDLERWAGVAGVYVFVRRFGKHMIPLYIGKAGDVGLRIKQHLNTTKLMLGIKNGAGHDRPPGKRMILVGEFIAKSGQSSEKCIRLAETILISHALASGYSLLNIKGTKTLTHSINFSGYLGAKKFTGRELRAVAK